MNTYNECKAIVELDLVPIKNKLMHKESGEGWTLEQANAVAEEYRRFLYLSKIFPNEEIAPLVEVDTFWHYHILDTRKYALDCQTVFGYFLHHFPYVGFDGEDGLLDHERLGKRSRDLYAQTFGESYAAKTGARPSPPDAIAHEADSTAFCSKGTEASATGFCSKGTAFCSKGVDIKTTAFCSKGSEASATAFCSKGTAFCSKGVDTKTTAFCSKGTEASATAFCSKGTAFCSKGVDTKTTAFCSKGTAFCSKGAEAKATAFCSKGAAFCSKGTEAKTAAFCSKGTAFCSKGTEAKATAFCSKGIALS